MKTGTTTSRIAQPAVPTLRTALIAATLACSAGLSLAAPTASVAITWFGASAEQFSGNYVVAKNPSQSFAMAAFGGGGDSDAYSAPNWNMGLDRLAETGLASATGNLVTFTDPSTQLSTAGFNLAASATQSTTKSSMGFGTASQSGSFGLVDTDGNSVGGSITFSLYYDLSVASPVGPNYAQTSLNLTIFSPTAGAQSFSDGLFSGAVANGAGSNSGFFNWTLNLAAGETATYTLSANAVAVAVPEPSSYAMLGAGLLAIGAVARRRRNSMDS